VLYDLMVDAVHRKSKLTLSLNECFGWSDLRYGHVLRRRFASNRDHLMDRPDPLFDRLYYAPRYSFSWYIEREGKDMVFLQTRPRRGTAFRVRPFWFAAERRTENVDIRLCTILS